MSSKSSSIKEKVISLAIDDSFSLDEEKMTFIAKNFTKFFHRNKDSYGVPKR